MGGGDVDHRVESVRREFGRLHIQSPGRMPPQMDRFLTQPHDTSSQLASRYARRVYVGGFPSSASGQRIARFFNQAMAAVGGNTAGPGNVVLQVEMTHERVFAFVEMRSVEEASNAMALDGILFQGKPLTVRRPADYNPALAASMGPSMPNPKLDLGAVGLRPPSAGGLEGPDRIFVGGLPYEFTETEVRELLESFGDLRGFDLVKDRETGNSKGYAFCVYQDPSVTDNACAVLNGMSFGDKTLTARWTKQTSKPETRLGTRLELETIRLRVAQQDVQIQHVLYAVGAVPTKVVRLVQVVTADELKDNEAYENTMEDMRFEACKYGNLVKVVIPRPDPSGRVVSGVGNVFLEYTDIYGATRAKIALHGKKIDGKPVVAIYYPEHKFAHLELDG